MWHWSRPTSYDGALTWGETSLSRGKTPQAHVPLASIFVDHAANRNRGRPEESTRGDQQHPPESASGHRSASQPSEDVSHPSFIAQLRPPALQSSCPGPFFKGPAQPRSLIVCLAVNVWSSFVHEAASALPYISTDAEQAHLCSTTFSAEC